MSQTGIQASDFSQVLSHLYKTTHTKNVTQVEETIQTKEMCEMFKVVYFILRINFHYCIIYIYANKISPNILEHGFFFYFLLSFIPDYNVRYFP